MGGGQDQDQAIRANTKVPITTAAHLRQMVDLLLEAIDAVSFPCRAFWEFMREPRYGKSATVQCSRYYTRGEGEGQCTVLLAVEHRS
jgi:hypothetical protein